MRIVPYRVILICVLMGAYLLTFNDRIQSADGYAILATAQTGNINIMGAVDYLIIPKGRMGTFGIDGNLYSKKGITPSLALVPLVWLNDLLPDAPLQATAHLFNSIISTLTALVLFDVVMRLGYAKRTAFIIGLMLGWGSLYWVYTQTLFAEPLAGLLIVVIVRMMLSPTAPLAGLQKPSARGFEPLTLAMGILLGLLAGINLTYIAFIPIFAIVQFTRTRRVSDLMVMGMGAVLTIAILVGMVNLSRYGALTETGYKFGEGERFSTPLLTGLYGLYLSPWRGMIWYMPLIWLVPMGLWLTYRKNRALAVCIIACVIVQSVIYALWWSWHGGVVWGARFLVPIVPLFVLSLAPVVQFSTNLYPLRVQSAIRILIISVFIMSVLMQLLGTMYDFNTHEGILYATHADKLDHALMYHPELSAIIANMTMLIKGEPFHWAWMKHGDAVMLVMAISLFVLAGLATIIRHRHMPLVVLILVGIGMCITAIRGESAIDRAKRHDLQTALSPPAPIIATTDDTRLINLRGLQEIRTIYAPTSPNEPFIADLWHHATADSGLHWLVTWFNPANPDNWMERELFMQHAFVKEVWAGDYRAVLFYLHPPALNWVDASWIFGDTITLRRYALSPDDDGVFIALEWDYVDRLPAHWGWFVHILDANGAIIAQQDRLPLGGYAPPDGARDRLYVLTSAGRATSARIGWVADGALIPVSGEDGIASDFIILSIAER